MDSPESILDDLFHGCALAAFVEQASRAGSWPESEDVRRRAYALDEQSLSDAPNRASGDNVTKLSHKNRAKYGRVEF
jgi:hypothetical protein